MDLFKILIDRVKDMTAEFVRLMPQLVIALLVLVLTWLIAHWVRAGIARVVGRTRLRPSLGALFVTLAGIATWIFGILVSMAVVLPGFTAGNLLAVLGFGSVAIGFAFKDIFENFLAGILIMMRRKMRMGDLIECDQIIGRVEQITLRETYVRRLDNELTIVPNSYLFKNPVRIVTDGRRRRHEITVGVAYSTDLDQAREVIEQAVRKVDLVKADRPVDVFAREFNNSSIDFTVRWWGGPQQVDMHKSRDAVIRSIKREFDDAGIEIPFPQRDLNFRNTLEMARPEVSKD